MGTPQNLFGTSRTLPADGDTNWGSEIREILIDMMKAMDNMSTMVTDDLPFLVLKGTAVTVTGGVSDYVLPATSNRYDVTGDGGPQNIDEIATGATFTDGQTLLIVGQSDSNTVEMDSDDSASTKWIINGDIILKANDAIFLSYDSGTSRWIEISRSN
jgi:hypothetical protein